MKLLRWAMAGASAFAVYKYSIGKKAKGEDVLASPEKMIAGLTGEPVKGDEAAPGPKTRKPRVAKAAKTPKAD